MAGGPHVVDVDASSFEEAVLERSHDVPVVVDFWAAWCGPCRTLGPTLESAVAARDGAAVLAKVDVDDNPTLAQQFRVQGIPAVKAFRDGRVVDEFTGAINAQQVEAFLDALLAAPATDEAATDETSGDGADEDGGTVSAEELQELSDHAEAHQDDDAAMLPYGRALAGAGLHTEAIEVLLHGIGLQGEARDDLRSALVDLLSDLGDDDPRVLDARRRLARLLF